MASSLVTKPSSAPLRFVSKAPLVVGKTLEPAKPATYAMPWLFTSMADPVS